MLDNDYLWILKQDSVDAWNRLRDEHPYTGVYLDGADLGQFDLRGAYLSGVSFSGANLTGANLSGCTLGEIQEIEHDIPVGTMRSSLNRANLTEAKLRNVTLHKVEL